LWILLSGLYSFSHGRGRRITSLGVIFNFTGNDVNTTVQPVANMVKEQWVRYLGRLICLISTWYPNVCSQFSEAIAEEPDAFVLIG
jgi:hypothetical protein